MRATGYRAGSKLIPSSTEFQFIEVKFLPQRRGTVTLPVPPGVVDSMRNLVLVVLALWPSCADAHYRITRDHGGLVDQYKAKYAKIRDQGDRVVIDGICNSACTLVLGIVPLNRICVTPNASLGFHEAYFDKSWTFGIRVTSYAGTADMVSTYPPPVRDWIRQHGGLAAEMKHVGNGPDLWAMVDPCPEEF
jgi:hypothetical protein